MAMPGAAQRSGTQRAGEQQEGLFQRRNELTLARLRPGVDSMDRARKLYGKHWKKKPSPGGEAADRREVWRDICTWKELQIEYNEKGVIQSVTALVLRPTLFVDCFGGNSRGNPWRTGRGLQLRDTKVRVLELYGAPDSLGPSTEGGRELELMFYAFDWAGADVPQVMEVTIESGRVVQILLAAQSL